MSLASLSIKRPTFITSLVALIIVLGLFAFSKLGVDIFPNVTFPVVTVTIQYPGAGPEEVETLVTKTVEDELSTVSGLKRITSSSQEGVSTVITEFTLETDVKYAEQVIRDRVSGTKRKLPTDIKEPIIRRIDPADQPILILAVNTDLPPAEAYDLANEVIRPKLEQISQVGLVEVIGGRKREIHVELDRDKLKYRQLSANLVSTRLGLAGENVPLGKVDTGGKELVFRSLGQFGSLGEIKNTIVNFVGNDVPIAIRDIGEVKDALADEKSRAFVNGKKSLFLYVFKQSGANTIAVANAIKKQIEFVNKELSTLKSQPKIEIVRDGAKAIEANVYDVKESIIIGSILAVLVVYLFLGNIRSTLITGLALPNSLIGAFVLMALAGFTINIMTLLALSLSVGLLVDDAIVVRENIFRHIEMGKSAAKAALEGTLEVSLAVIATTLVILAVFGPVAFLQGVVGQFFKEFGLTICFAMIISLFDALTIAPMLSAYFAGNPHKTKKNIWDLTVGQITVVFDKFQTWLENMYERTLKFTLKKPIVVLGLSTLFFIASFATIAKVPKTFLPPQDNGEFSVDIDLPPGTSLQETHDVAKQIDELVRQNPEVRLTALTVGGRGEEAYVASIYVNLVPSKERKKNTTQMKDSIREQVKKFEFAKPKVKDFDMMGAGQRPFNLNIIGFDQKELERIAGLVFEKAKAHPGLRDPDISYRPGKPEFQVALDKMKAQEMGVSSIMVGSELRTQIAGATPAKFRESGREYDIRVLLKESQRNLKESFAQTSVPNINNFLIPLKSVANSTEAIGPAKITRQDRGRYIQISADIAPGVDLNGIMNDLNNYMEKDIKLPQGFRFAYVGQAESFQELQVSMATALLFGIIFIYMVLASLYESFVTPFTIMLALPFAISGSFMGLFVVQQSLNIFSMIGAIMLMGIAAKNSILLVDYANQLIDQGMDRSSAIIKSGKTRLRPILMTSMAMIAGAVPIAMGLNEASKQRTSMGVAIIGGLITSTFLTLVVVPAAFSYIDRFRLWSKLFLSKLFSTGSSESHSATGKTEDELLPQPNSEDKSITVSEAINVPIETKNVLN